MGRGSKNSSKKHVQKSKATEVPSSSSTNLASPEKFTHEEINEEGSHVVTSNKSNWDANNASNSKPKCSASETSNVYQEAFYAAIGKILAESLNFHNNSPIPQGSVCPRDFPYKWVMPNNWNTSRIVFHTMADGNEILLDLIDGFSEESSLHSAFYDIIDEARRENNMVVGFDTEFVSVNFNGKTKSCVWLIKLCISTRCLLIKLDPLKKSFSPYLQNFLSLKEIIFVGLHLKEDLTELKSHYGLIVRNAVELGELAANVLGQPRLVAYGIRELAREVLSFELEQRPLSVMWGPVWSDNWTPEHEECAATDTYALYKIGTKLLVDREAGQQ